MILCSSGGYEKGIADLFGRFPLYKKKKNLLFPAGKIITCKKGLFFSTGIHTECGCMIRFFLFYLPDLEFDGAEPDNVPAL